MNTFRFAFLLMVLAACHTARGADSGSISFPGAEGPGAGKRIVLIAGDEEYRSEETMPMLAQILSVRHGFHCTVVFSLAEDGTIDPNNQESLVGLQALENADLMIIFTRFRRPPNEAMDFIDDYLQAGKPVIGLRTATHAFAGLEGKYAHYNNNHRGDKWTGGFGREILGEKWISHHGRHGRQSTRGVIPQSAKDHPIVTGIQDGEIWGTTDVYTVRLPLPGDSRPLVLGQVLEGMRPDDDPVEGEKNDPLMPVTWTKTYQTDDGKIGRVFTTTMGASQDFVKPGLRRLLVNAVYWSLSMEDQITPDLRIDFVSPFDPSPFGFKAEAGYWKRVGRRPSDYALQD